MNAATLVPIALLVAAALVSILLMRFIGRVIQLLVVLGLVAAAVWFILF